MGRMTTAHCEGREAMLVAFDLLEHDGADLCALPLIERKRRHTIPTASKTETRLGSKAMRLGGGRADRSTIEGNR